MHFYCRQCSRPLKSFAALCEGCGNVFSSPVPIDNGTPGIEYWPLNNPQGLHKDAKTISNAWNGLSNELKASILGGGLVLMIVGGVVSFHNQNKPATPVVTSVQYVPAPAQPVRQQVAAVPTPPAASQPDPKWNTASNDAPVGYTAHIEQSPPSTTSLNTNDGLTNVSNDFTRASQDATEEQQRASNAFQAATTDASNCEYQATNEDLQFSRSSLVYANDYSHMTQDLTTMEQSFPYSDQETHMLFSDNIASLQEKINEFHSDHKQGNIDMYSINGF